MKLALEALETESDLYRENNEDGAPDYIWEAITALREALAQPQQEPAAYLFTNVQSGDIETSTDPDHKQDDREMWFREVLVRPAARKPLTDAQIETVWRSVQANDFHDCVKPFARALEAKHGIEGDV